MKPDRVTMSLGLSAAAIFLFISLSDTRGEGPHRAEEEVRVPLRPDMVANEAAWGNPGAIADEQDSVGEPPSGNPKRPWDTSWSPGAFPAAASIDLGAERFLSAIWVFDVHDVGPIEIEAGGPGAWRKVAEYRTEAYMQWARIPIDVAARRIRIVRFAPGAQIAEIALYAYTPAGWRALQEKKEAEARASEERRAALERAAEEAKRRPAIDLGQPFGELTLVDEVECPADPGGRIFAEYPAGASRVESLLGRSCRVLPPRPGEASFISWRIGRHKLLRPGGAYLVVLEYPEDAPRSMVVLNGGCETARGFHTGTTVGDALRQKYVWSNPESIATPLSGRIEAWKQFFFLHDRFPERGFIRGSGRRALPAEEGLPFTVAQFSSENDPTSRGIAVARIRLYEVPDPGRLAAPVRPPPEGLPRRHLFWREEMADGVIDGAKVEDRGVTRMLDWYRHKAGLLRFLGMDTFAKDLLEFGACQHWDPAPGGGHDWVYSSERHKHLWEEIVELMGREGFSILPYYEYGGSRGAHGLGDQKRARPLTRDDAFTHISWVESANADLTDPDTLADFRKMLDVTVLRFKDLGRFLGAWLRQRGQIPMGFGDATRARFATERNEGRPVSRADLIADRSLLERYEEWWLGRRRAFLEAVRDHLRAGLGREDAAVLFTADSSEPGVGFPTWEPRLVTDDPAGWKEILAVQDPKKGRPIAPVPLDGVVRDDLFLGALLSPPLDWGGWEVGHAYPAADPARYRDVPGVLLTHGFNRAYTVGSPRTFDAFRGPSGLAAVRHHALNENMFFDREDKDLLGYVCADMERAGPYCMLAEVRAAANGDPWWIGYLVGSSFNRGFPEHVRDFDAAFLALPALPSHRLEGAAEDPEVVVREIPAGSRGTWYAVANVGLLPKRGVVLRLPAPGPLSDAVTGLDLAAKDGRPAIDLGPCSLRALRRPGGSEDQERK